MRRSKMKEREKLRMGSCLEKPNEGSDHGRLQPDRELAEWRMEEKNQKFRTGVQKTQYMMMDKTDIRLLGDHLDMFQDIYRDWNQKADHLTHVAREKGCTWNSFVKKESDGKSHLLSSSNWTYLF